MMKMHKMGAKQTTTSRTAILQLVLQLLRLKVKTYSRHKNDQQIPVDLASTLCASGLSTSLLKPSTA